MKQQVSVITVPVGDLDVSKAFYCKGLGWTPVFDDGDIVFFQLNGMVLGLWRIESFEKEINSVSARRGRTFALGHNVDSPEAVDKLIGHAWALGAEILRSPRGLPWGGYSGSFSDPDGHVWEVAYNPAWPISEEGYVTFKS